MINWIAVALMLGSIAVQGRRRRLSVALWAASLIALIVAGAWIILIALVAAVLGADIVAVSGGKKPWTRSKAARVTKRPRLEITTNGPSGRGARIKLAGQDISAGVSAVQLNVSVEGLNTAVFHMLPGEVQVDGEALAEIKATLEAPAFDVEWRFVRECIEHMSVTEMETWVANWPYSEWSRRLVLGALAGMEAPTSKCSRCNRGAVAGTDVCEKHGGKAPAA